MKPLFSLTITKGIREVVFQYRPISFVGFCFRKEKHTFLYRGEMKNGRPDGWGQWRGTQRKEDQLLFFQYFLFYSPFLLFRWQFSWRIACRILERRTSTGTLQLMRERKWYVLSLPLFLSSCLSLSLFLLVSLSLYSVFQTICVSFFSLRFSHVLSGNIFSAVIIGYCSMRTSNWRYLQTLLFPFSSCFFLTITLSLVHSCLPRDEYDGVLTFGVCSVECCISGDFYEVATIVPSLCLSVCLSISLILSFFSKNFILFLSWLFNFQLFFFSIFL